MSARRPTRLPRWQERAVYLSFGLLLATGLAWLVLDHWVRVAGEFGPEHHPAEHWMLIFHAVGAYAFLVLVGATIPVHIPLGWNQRRNRLSGVTLVGILALLGLTALGLYYIGADTLRASTSLVHWVVGIVAVPGLLLHVTRNRTRLTNSARNPSQRRS